MCYNEGAMRERNTSKIKEIIIMFNYNINEHKGENINEFIKAFTADAEYNSVTQDVDYEDTYYVDCYYGEEYELRVNTKNNTIKRVKKI